MKDVEEKCGRFYRNNPQYLDSIPDGQSHGFLWAIELRMIPYYSILQLQAFENSDSHYLLPKRTTTNISLVTPFSEAQTIAGAAACILVLGPQVGQVAFGCCTGNAIRRGNRWGSKETILTCIEMYPQKYLKISQNHGNWTWFFTLSIIFDVSNKTLLVPISTVEVAPLGAAGRGSAASRCC